MRLDLARLKAQFFAWRGAVRCGAISAVVTGALHHGDAEGTRGQHRSPLPQG